MTTRTPPAANPRTADAPSLLFQLRPKSIRKEAELVEEWKALMAGFQTGSQRVPEKVMEGQL